MTEDSVKGRVGIRARRVARLACAVVALGLFAFLLRDGGRWTDAERDAWNPSGVWFVMACVLAALTATAALVAMLNPILRWIVPVSAAAGTCAMLLAAHRATADASHVRLFTASYAVASALLALTALAALPTRWRATRFIAGCLLLIAGLAIFGSGAHRPTPVPLGFVMAMQATDDGAVLLWASLSREAAGYVSRVDAHGKTVWWSTLPCSPLTGRALLVGQRIATVRCTHRTPEAPYGSDQTVVAYDLTTGHQAWERRMAAYDRRERLDDASLDLYTTSAFVAGRLIEWVDRGTSGRSLFSLDPRTGAVLAQPAWDADLSETLAIGSRVIQHEVSKVRTFDVMSGAVAAYQARGVGCIVDNDYVTIDGATSEKTALVAFSQGDLSSRRVIRAPFTAAKDSLLRRCGTYRDRIVLPLEVGYTDGSQDVTVVIAARNGDVQHSISIPNDGGHGDGGGQAIGERYYDHATLAGELPRFVPYLRHGSDRRGDAGPQLLVLDLEQGTIAWKGSSGDVLRDAYLFRGTTQWYLVSGFYQDVITVIDGDTGQLTHATMAHEYEGTLDILPMDVRGGRLWIANRDHQPVNHAPVTILDERTLAPLVKSATIELRDMTAQRRRDLGSAD